MKMMFLVLGAVWLAIAAVGCSKHRPAYAKVSPAKVTIDPSGGLPIITLTADAIKRLDIITNLHQGGPRGEIAKGVLLYGADGSNSVFLYLGNNLYQRHVVKVLGQEGSAVLLGGIPPGSQVVTQGAAELYGVEEGIGK